MVTVAVVVSTYERPQLLERLLTSLATQHEVDYEIVAVDNGSRDDTSERLERLRAELDLPLRPLRVDDNRGPARARNLGWRSTDAEWIAFTDDDCEATPAWLAGLLAAAAREDAGIVQGRTLPDPASPHRGQPWHKSQRIEAFTDRYETCNLLVHRPVLEALEGFDEEFPAAAGEDTDLGWRAKPLGVRTAFADDAVVFHSVSPPSFVAFLRGRSRWATMVPMYSRHPGLRRMLVWRLFYRRSHIVVLVGLPTIVAASLRYGAWVAPAALAAWAVADAFRMRHHDWPLWLRLVRSQQLLVAAAWETAAFARESIRRRGLVL